MARISREEVERVAELARLSLSPAEAESMSAELARILDFVEELSELDTRDVEPTSHVIPLATPLRDDRPEPPMDAAVAVANAPERMGSAFVVPKVIEGEEAG